jgi:polyhydroxyalkanoate synthesis regulator phasin
MIEDMRRYVEAGLGSLTPAKAREMAQSLRRGQGTEQVNRLAGTLMDWSRRSRERISELVQAEVRRQLRAVGVATRDDLDALRKRVRDLEKASAASPSARSATSRRSSPKKSTARKSSTGKSSTGKSSAKPSGDGSSSTSSSSGSDS